MRQLNAYELSVVSGGTLDSKQISVLIGTAFLSYGDSLLHGIFLASNVAMPETFVFTKVAVPAYKLFLGYCGFEVSNWLLSADEDKVAAQTA